MQCNKYLLSFLYLLQIVKIFNFLSGYTHIVQSNGVTLANTGEAVAINWQLKVPTIRQKWIVITSIPVQYTDEGCANRGKYWCVII